MRIYLSTTCLLLLLHLYSPAQAQSTLGEEEPTLATDSLFYLSLDDELELDSLSIFLLLDSLIQASEASSELIFRAGYKTNLTIAGRDYFDNLAGVSAGMSYYHYSGFFADMYGNWNTNSSPSYYLSALSGGYLGLIGKQLSYSGSVSIYSYNNEIDFSEGSYYTHSFDASLNLNFSKLTLSTDYSLLLGDGSAHRFSASATGYFKIRGLGFADYIAFLPNASVLVGNQTITSFGLEERQITRLVRERGARALRNYVENREVYGIMNYYLSVPVTIKKGNLRFAVSYNYNIPVALPGEELSTDNSYYTSFNLYYTIPFRHYLN